MAIAERLQPLKEGWFHTPGRLGDRTLEQQLQGIGWLLEHCRGRTVLDVGCAEGLIAIELARRGAAAVHGVEIVAAHLEVAHRLRGDLPVTFERGDANVWMPRRRYDIVAALALLHKLRDPSAACARLAAAARWAVVLRLPPARSPVIVDARSGGVRHDINAAMRAAGFAEPQVSRGPLDEWVGVYLRD